MYQAKILFLVVKRGEIIIPGGGFRILSSIQMTSFIQIIVQAMDK